MRRPPIVRNLIVGLFLCGLSLPFHGEIPPSSPPVITHPPSKHQGFFDYALGKVNPADRDYGATMQAGRDAVVTDTVDDLFFWSNVLTLLLFSVACTLLLHQWRSADKREAIAAALIAQLWNGRVSDRIEIHRRTEQFNRLVEAHNAETEKVLIQKSQSPDSEKSADESLNRSVRKLTDKRAAASTGGPAQLRLAMDAAPQPESGDSSNQQQSNLLLQRRVEALQNNEQNLKQRLNQTTVLLDQERRRNSTLKGA